MAGFQSENTPSAQPPPELDANPNPTTSVRNSRDEACADMDTENFPSSNGFSAGKLSNVRVETLRISGNNSFRRSPRLVNNAKAESAAKEVNSAKLNGFVEKSPPSKKHKSEKKVSFFIGDPVPEDEARRRWPWRIEDDDGDEELVLDIKCHYSQAEILKTVFYLGDCAYVKGPKGGSDYVGKIIEFFETIDGEDYFRVQWFFRAEDTVIKDDGISHDKKRLFYSTLMNDNLLDCIVSKVEVVQIPSNVNLKAQPIPPCDFYFDMQYSVDYSTFSTIVKDTSSLSPLPYPLTTLTKNEDGTCKNIHQCTTDETNSNKLCNPELALLDLYSGCGGMSTGLCIGCKASGINLVTRWAVDLDEAACQSLKLNHPETHIRCGYAEDFLHLLKEWDSLCKTYGCHEEKELRCRINRDAGEDKETKENHKRSSEYAVEKLVDICYGDPTGNSKRGLKFKVRWEGYGPSDDTWEPIGGLSKCHERIQDFVLKGMKARILPRPGDVAVICGGPPCQGISGYNRFRNADSPLDDERNRQIVIFMDIIDFLRPKFVLMENVIDILRFANGCLGRYAISQLRNVVAYDEGQHRDLEKIVVLGDAISDLPPGANYRDLPGIVIGSNNVVTRARDPELMPSGKHWVPDYAINFRGGTSKAAFGRLWWDETVPTVLCYPDPRSRVSIFQLGSFSCALDIQLIFKYRQVGNAVAVSVGRALGYSLGMAVQKLSGDEHLMTLPPKFSHSTTLELLSSLEK
ncbi:DNA (cytosine-5)-methyltransferase CMT2 [Striga hermonthica]|uniref:DNA (cytosine-5-)-methyltransferase n=1 Tax=Striga hermonthica TaxID=68872 RepID=A0A9N7R5Z2_STRHE|nr:DNA (cytosine-5)-methyltransferase CMT2 [Striga hermonthica]